MSQITSLYKDFYSKNIFIRIKMSHQELKMLSSSNHCDMSFSIDGRNLVVMTAIDNLIKGAAGGSMQLMNKLWNLHDCQGLQSSSVPWI